MQVANLSMPPFLGYGLSQQLPLIVMELMIGLPVVMIIVVEKLVSVLY